MGGCRVAVRSDLLRRCSGCRRRHQEGVGEACILIEPSGEEGGGGSLHHLHRAAQVNLVAAQVGKVRQHGFVHQAGATSPAVACSGLREDRYHREVRVLALPLLAAFEHVQILAPAHAPVQAHRTLHAAREGVFDDALDGCETGGTGHEQDGVRTVAQREAAERAFEAQQVTHLHSLEHVGGKAPAGH